MLIRKTHNRVGINPTQPEMVALRSMGQLQNPDPTMRSGTLGRWRSVAWFPSEYATGGRRAELAELLPIENPTALPRQFDAVLKTELTWLAHFSARDTWASWRELTVLSRAESFGRLRSGAALTSSICLLEGRICA